MQAQNRLQELIVHVIAEASRHGDIRQDLSPDELATYCVFALAAAGNVRSKAAVKRLVALTLSGLQPVGG